MIPVEQRVWFARWFTGQFVLFVLLTGFGEMARTIRSWGIDDAA